MKISSRRYTGGLAVGCTIFCEIKAKNQTFEQEVMTVILYSSETWLTKKIIMVLENYNKLVKFFLGVRKNTSVDL